MSKEIKDWNSYMNKVKIKKSFGEKVFCILNITFMVLVCLTMIYPFINTLALSFNEGPDALKGGIYFSPRVFTLQNYEKIFRIIPSFKHMESRSPVLFLELLFHWLLPV